MLNQTEGKAMVELKCVTVTLAPEKCASCPCSPAGCQHSNAEFPHLIEEIRDNEDDCDRFVADPNSDDWWRLGEFFYVTRVKTLLVNETEL